MWRAFANRLRGREGSVLQPEDKKPQKFTVTAMLFVGLILALLILGTSTSMYVELLILILPGLILGSVVGTLLLKAHARMNPRALTARGSALKDQTEGFRTYIATAEAHQLNFEAGQDIYRGYLPWAVLFDLTDRWTKVCEELARMGRIAPLDHSFVHGASSAADVSRTLRSVGSATHDAHRDVDRADSRSSSGGGGFGGGSGGRSGFSSGSSGSGGGGGASSSSW